MAHEVLAHLLLVHSLQDPEVQVRGGFQHLESRRLTWQIQDVSALGCNEAKQVSGDVTRDIERADTIIARLF